MSQKQKAIFWWTITALLSAATYLSMFAYGPDSLPTIGIACLELVPFILALMATALCIPEVREFEGRLSGRLQRALEEEASKEA